MRGTAQQRGLSFAVHVGAAVEVLGDPERLKSVILNLLENAIRFSPVGETIDCSLEASDDAVTVTIRDMGPGIPEDEIPKLFRRFYQSPASRSAGNGAGLGLAIVERVVHLHGGTVGVESAPGLGAKFSFTVPLLSSSATDIPQA
jgi:signal transduction histidine kinase